MKARGVTPLAVAGIAMVIGFFGPWIDWLGLVRASGWTLATDGDDWKRHLLWLYPAGGALLAVAALRGAASARAIGLLVGGGVVAVALWNVGSGLVDNLRYGAWLTIGGAVIALATGIVKGDRTWSLIGGALVVIAFFLPWLWTSAGDEHPVSVTGWELARQPEPDWLKLLYVIPVLGAGAAASAFIAESKSRAASALAGIGILAVLAYLYVRVTSLTVGWGAWLTVGAGAAALAGALLLGVRRRPAATPA